MDYVAHIGELKNVCELVIGKAGGKKMLEIHRWENNFILKKKREM